MSYRTTPHTATGCPPIEILMGQSLRTRLELLHPDLSAQLEQKSRKLDPMIRRIFEVGEPVMVKDYHKRASAWSKGVFQDPLGLVTYQVQVGELLWKRHIDQLRELAGSKGADVEPNRRELPEIDLFEMPGTSNASVPVSEPDTLQPSAQKPTMPVIQATPQVQVPSPEQTIPSEEKIMERAVSSVPEETRCHSMRIPAKLKRLIEEM